MSNNDSSLEEEHWIVKTYEWKSIHCEYHDVQCSFDEWEFLCNPMPLLSLLSSFVFVPLHLCISCIFLSGMISVMAGKQSSVMKREKTPTLFHSASNGHQRKREARYDK